MDVQLYVYDLSQGMARSMSRQFLGIQIDAIYHTSVVVNDVEYFFGQGIQQSRPGATHHGRPMEVIPLGQTQLPPDVILEYLESMKAIYTPEAYDLFQNNCNNFSDEFARFLVGKGIPDHITSLPRTVLETPFGQMLRPQIDASMRAVTQAPVASSSLPPGPPLPVGNGTNGTSKTPSSKSVDVEHGQVYNIVDPWELDKLLAAAKASCATIFFTSSTCAPCKLAYPMFDTLAAQHPKALFIKVDINQAQSIGSKYQIRATPTFMTFLRGQKQEEWAGADPSRLKSSVEFLVHQAHPPHPHVSLTVATLQSGSLRPVSFPKIPPLDKVIAKLGAQSSSPAVASIRDFITTRAASATTHSPPPAPDFALWDPFFRDAPSTLSAETLFAALDLLRCLLLDPRVSSQYLSSPTLLRDLLSHVADLTASDACPYSLRLVALQLCCVLTSAPSFSLPTCPLLTPTMASLAASSLLSDPGKPALRGAAASLAFNLAAANYRFRREQGGEEEALGVEQQTELLAAALEALGEEVEQVAAAAAATAGGVKEGTHALVLALGYLVYFSDPEGEVWSVAQALGAAEVLGRIDAEGKVKEAVADVRKAMPPV